MVKTEHVVYVREQPFEALDQGNILEFYGKLIPKKSILNSEAYTALVFNLPDDVKTLHHMIIVWNAFAPPPVIPPTMLRNLGDYLTNFLKSGDGEVSADTRIRPDRGPEPTALSALPRPTSTCNRPRHAPRRMATSVDGSGAVG